MRQRLATRNPAQPPRHREGRVVGQLLRLAALRPCAVRLVTDNPAPAHLQELPLTLKGTACAALKLDRQAGRKRRHLPAREHAGARPPSTQLLADRFRTDHPRPTAGHAPVKQRLRRVQPHKRFEVSRLERRSQYTIDPHGVHARTLGRTREAGRFHWDARASSGAAPWRVAPLAVGDGAPGRSV